MKYELMIGLRYIFSRKKKGFVSFMSFVSIIGVAVGVACLITVLAVMNGFGYELQKRIVGSNPHVVIEKENGIAAADCQNFIKKIDALSHVKGAYPYVWGQGVLNFRQRAQGTVIRSVDLENRLDLTKLTKHMTSGKVTLGKGDIIIGNELSSALGAFIGDKIHIITPAQRRKAEFTVKGIFSSGMYEYDLNLAYVNMPSAMKLFGMKDAVSGIGIDVDNINNAAFVSKKLATMFDYPYYIRTWMDMNRNLFQALKLEKWAMFVILTLIVIVACLNIVSTLTVMVTHKAKDIGILKAVGASKKTIMAIFSLQGIVIGSIGVSLGAGIGMGLSFLLDKYHFAVLPESIYYGINYLPVKINIEDSFVIIASALFISFIASLYPAYQASRLHPVDALRYE